MDGVKTRLAHGEDEVMTKGGMSKKHSRTEMGGWRFQITNIMLLPREDRGMREVKAMKNKNTIKGGVKTHKRCRRGYNQGRIGKLQSLRLRQKRRYFNVQVQDNHHVRYRDVKGNGDNNEKHNKGQS